MILQVVALHLDAAGVAKLEYRSLQKSIQTACRISHTPMHVGLVIYLLSCKVVILQILFEK